MLKYKELQFNTIPPTLIVIFIPIYKYGQCVTHTRTAMYQHKLLHIKSGLCYTLGNCKRPPLDPLLPGDLFALLAIVGLVRVFGLEGTLRCERGLEDLLAEERLDTRLVAGEEDWMVILSLRTNMPCLSLHLKYFTPLTVPLFLPATMGRSEQIFNER